MQQEQLRMGPMWPALPEPSRVDDSVLARIYCYEDACRESWSRRRNKKVGIRKHAQLAGMSFANFSKLTNGQIGMREENCRAYCRVVGNTLVPQWLAWVNGLGCAQRSLTDEEAREQEVEKLRAENEQLRRGMAA